MHLPTFTRRDGYAPPSLDGYESGCKTSFSWFRLCPIDFFFWALIVLAICVVFWTLYTRRRRAMAAGVSETPLTGQIPTRSRHKGYHRLTLPYPSGKYSSDPSPTYNEYEYESNYDPSNASMDPYHVVNNLDNSLISKDVHFNGASVPLPALDQKKSGKLGVGLGLGISMTDRGSPIPEYDENVTDEKSEEMLTPPPPPAYLRNPRWDM